MILSPPFFWTVFTLLLCQMTGLLITINKILNKGAFHRLIAILALLTLSDLFLLSFLKTLNHRQRQCQEYFEPLTILLCVEYVLMISLDLLPYLILAVFNWDLSYELEDIVNPFSSSQQRPCWHQWVNLSLSTLITVSLTVLAALYGWEELKHQTEWSAMLWTITSGTCFLFYLCICVILVAGLLRIQRVTENSEYHPNLMVVRGMVGAFAINAVCFLAFCAAFIIDQERFYEWMTLVYAISLCVSQSLMCYIAHYTVSKEHQAMVEYETSYKSTERFSSYRVLQDTDYHVLGGMLLPRDDSPDKKQIPLMRSLTKKR